MAKRKPTVTRSSRASVTATKATRKGKSPPANPLESSSRATVSGPSCQVGKAKALATDALALKLAATAEMAAAFPYNAAKAAEYDPKQAADPPAGQAESPSFPRALASTLSENSVSPKVGGGAQHPGTNPNNGPLDRIRVDSTGQVPTTNQGVAVADNQSSLKAGLRGPALLEDFILREKITHFDHERIPERVVHACLDAGDIDAAIAAIGKHRHFDRQTDPSLI